MTSSITKDSKSTIKQSSQQPDQEAAEQSEQGIEDQIAEIAYYKAENRGFTPGNELNDWLEAEQEIAMIFEDVGSQS